LFTSAFGDSRPAMQSMWIWDWSHGPLTASRLHFKLYIFFAIWLTFLRSFTTFYIFTSRLWKRDGVSWLGGVYWKGRLVLFGGHLGGLPHTLFTVWRFTRCFLVRKNLWVASRTAQGRRGGAHRVTRPRHKTQPEANTIDPNSHITCFHFFSSGEIWKPNRNENSLWLSIWYR